MPPDQPLSDRLLTDHAERLVLAGGALAVGVVAISEFRLPASLLCCTLGWTMLAIAAVDCRRFIIPDRLSLPAVPAGLAAAMLVPHDRMAHEAVVENLIAAAAASLALWLLRAVYLRFRGREGLGLGDVKLIAVAGAWTGMSGVLSVLLMAATSALVVTGGRALAGDRSIGAATAVPFGAFLAPCIWLVWLAQQLGLLPLE